jgi:hypothetical protein
MADGSLNRGVAPSLRLPVETSDILTADVCARLPNLSLSEAQRVAAVVRNFPTHWRQWSPSDPWDRTLDHVLAFARALDAEG